MTNHLVHVLNIQTIDDEDAQLSGICLSPNGDDLYVTDGLYNNVQVLRTGKFITPLGVCVSSDGELIVADTWNYRIQVFQI
jgi:sugar lactone lactonase YvrE